MKSLPMDTVLVVVDVQKAFDDTSWGLRNNPGAEARIAALLARWRTAGRPLVHVHHRSRSLRSLFHPDRPGFEVKPEALPLPGELVIFKDVNSAFIGTDLDQRLRSQGAHNLVIAGMTTDHCVSTTTRMAGNLGYRVHIVADATATFGRSGPDGRFFSAQIMHDTALASLHDEFASVVSTAKILALSEPGA